MQSLTNNNRSVKKYDCPACGDPLWAGLDADILAEKAIVEAGVFLTKRGERGAILGGRGTWAFEYGPPSRIYLRDKYHRQARKAAEVDEFGRPLLVVVEHFCDRQIPDWAIFNYERPARAVVSEEPPF